MNKNNIQKILASNPAARPSYFRRPHWTRRNFFQLMGAGVTASFLAKEADAQAAGTCTSQNMTTINKATNVIFILMTTATVQGLKVNLPKASTSPVVAESAASDELEAPALTT